MNMDSWIRVIITSNDKEIWDCDRAHGTKLVNEVCAYSL